MANSLRAKLSKLKHKGHIDNAEHQELINKLDGHDRELRAKAIDELVNEAMRSFTEYDLTERIATVAGCKMLLMKVAEQLKAGGKDD